MKIRKATLKDCKVIVEIDLQSDDPFYKVFPIKSKKDFVKYFKKILKQNNVEFYLYEDKGIIGVKKDFPGYKHLELFWISVKAKYQNRGIGKKLIKFVESYAKKHNYRAVYLYTHPIHKKAIKLYKKIGYKKINEFPNYYSNGDRSLLFGKKLR